MRSYKGFLQNKGKLLSFSGYAKASSDTANLLNLTVHHHTNFLWVFLVFLVRKKKKI
jgi:hypothetical protein